MARYRESGLLMVAVFAAYWAYEVVDSLIREFSASITYIDLGVVFVLGLITGICLGAFLALKRG